MTSVNYAKIESYGNQVCEVVVNWEKRSSKDKPWSCAHRVLPAAVCGSSSGLTLNSKSDLETDSALSFYTRKFGKFGQLNFGLLYSDLDFSFFDCDTIRQKFTSIIFLSAPFRGPPLYS